MLHQEQYNLNSRDLAILNFVIDTRNENGFSPTYREIVWHLSLVSNEQAFRSIERLKRLNLINSDPNLKGKSRTIVPTEEALIYVDSLIPNQES
jgi:SOS-response transcriptional repressor LexA